MVQKKTLNKNFSKNLWELRSIAQTITRNRKIKVKYDAKAENSCYNPETHEITLTLKPYPNYVKENRRIAEKILDADLGHECGHDVLSKPIWSFYNNWLTKIKRKRGYLRLAREIVNVVEDIRVNHFITLRYRHDIGKRLQLANLILKDVVDNQISKIPDEKWLKMGDATIMLGILVNEGIYEGDCSKAKQFLSESAKTDLNEALRLLEAVKYKRLKIDLLKTTQKTYELIAKYVKGDEYKLNSLIPARRGGKIVGEISQGLKERIEAQLKAEEAEEAKAELESLIKDLLKGGGAGEGTGEEISAPEPDFNHYSELLDRNKEEIRKLLDKLKQLLKPIVKREIFQKRGKIMAGLLAKSRVNSIRREVKNVYLSVKSRLEKEQVAIGFLIDFSGSVPRKTAENITTVLNEVFGKFVDDYGFSISVFGANSQKIKTFFETFQNTRARIGNISVDASGTEISQLLMSYLKMFNAIVGNRRKILVIASDFSFHDDDDARAIIKAFPLSNVELVFLGFGNWNRSDTWASDSVKARRTSISDITELPEAFLSVYLDVQR